MPKTIDLRIHGVGFKEGLRRMLATPAPKDGKPSKKTVRKARRRK
jgi:hypothetical protein